MFRQKNLYPASSLPSLHSFSLLYLCAPLFVILLASQRGEEEESSANRSKEDSRADTMTEEK